jgi:hypothetical protein
MQEALHSFNVKFKMQGFECQLTVRDDEKGTGLIVSQGQAVVKMLAGLVGVTSNGNGNGAAKLACPVCGKDDQLEAIVMKTGKKVFKCHRCEKWLPDKK